MHSDCNCSGDPQELMQFMVENSMFSVKFVTEGVSKHRKCVWSDASHSAFMLIHLQLCQRIVANSMASLRNATRGAI